MQRLSAALHGTLGSCLRGAFHKGRQAKVVVIAIHVPHEGSADAVACLPVPRA